MEENKAQSFTDIWSLKDEIIDKNISAKREVLDIPDEDLLAKNVNGFVINALGNIVAQFGFFIETDGKERIDIKISPDGFMASIYNKPTNILLGYGHPLGFIGLVDPTQSNILHLGPEHSMGDDVIISIQNDEKLENQGIVCIIRDIDVMTEILPSDVREDFEQSKIEASKALLDLNEIEKSYNDYMKHIYQILGETIKKDETTSKEEINEQK